MTKLDRRLACLIAVMLGLIGLSGLVFGALPQGLWATPLKGALAPIFGAAFLIFGIYMIIVIRKEVKRGVKK